MFTRMLSAFGVGGPSVDTVLDTPHTTPGQVVTGQVRIQGGNNDAHIDEIVLSLVTRVEVEHGDHEFGGAAEFLRLPVAHGVRVAAGQPMSVPFQLPIPWETPITSVGGHHLPGMTIGVRTELIISGAPDKGDLDPIHVLPTPAQDRVLEAIGRLGFQFRGADLETGRIHGVNQELGFYQEIEFFPPGQYAGRITEVELTFITNPHELVVVLEADKRGGMFSPGGDSFGRFHLSHQDAMTTDWASAIDQWMAQVAQHGGHSPAFGGHPQHANPAFGHSPAHAQPVYGQPHAQPAYGQPGHSQPPVYGQPAAYGHSPQADPAFGHPPTHGQPAYGHQSVYGHPGHGHHGHHGHHGGSGMGGVVAGAAAGVVGGMILGEVMEDVFEDDGGEE